MENYSAEISKALLLLSKYRANTREVIDNCVYLYDFNDDERIIGLLQTMVDLYRNQIHGYLVPLENKQAEQEIRLHIKDISREILPIVENKVRKLTAEILSLENKIKRYSSKRSELLKEKEKQSDFQVKYVMLNDDFTALVAFRVLETYVLYLEQDFPRQVWKPTLELFKGFWFYMTQMILDGKIQFIEKQLFTGIGKSFSDIMAITFILGHDINDDILKVFGAKDNVAVAMDSVRQIMTSKRYAKVFPYFEQFNGQAEEMFETCRIQDGEMKIRGSKKPRNLLIASKDVKLGGVRAKYLFLDDITQAEDAENITAHKKDIYKYENVWFKRNYGLNNFYVVASGTTYSRYDILSTLKTLFGGEDATQTKINKFTTIAQSDEIINGGISVFVCVPKLDYETDESTCPALYPTDKARKQRDKDKRIFEAMEQQKPLPPETTPFDYCHINTYSSLPTKESVGGKRSDYCKAVLDPARKGKDNLALGILSKSEDIEYLIDCFYKLCPLDFKLPNGQTALEHCCDLIIKHNVTHLLAENNTVSNIKEQILTILARKGYNKCIVIEKYTTQPKPDKINSAQATILNNIAFPEEKLYARSSMMGRFMADVTTWYYGTREHDDAPDCCAMFANEFISGNVKKAGTIEILRRKR